MGHTWICQGELVYFCVMARATRWDEIVLGPHALFFDTPFSDFAFIYQFFDECNSWIYVLMMYDMIIIDLMCMY